MRDTENNDDRPKSSEEMLREFRSNIEDLSEDTVETDDDTFVDDDAGTETDTPLSAAEIAESLYPAPASEPPPVPPLPPPPRSLDAPPPPPVTRPGDDPYQPQSRPATGDDRAADRGEFRPPTQEKSFFQRYGGLLVGLGIAGVIGFSLLSDSTTAVDEVGIGDCIEAPDGVIVETVKTVPCDDPHDYEIFALLTHPSGPYPGEDPLFDYAYSECVTRFEGYVGLAFEDSEVWYDVFAPTRESWDQGDRGITCLLYLTDADFNLVTTEGSLRNSNR